MTCGIARPGERLCPACGTHHVGAHPSCLVCHAALPAEPARIGHGGREERQVEVSVDGFCTSCGAERRQGDRFCRACGNALGQGAQPTAVTPGTAPVEVTRPIVPAPPKPRPTAGYVAVPSREGSDPPPAAQPASVTQELPATRAPTAGAPGSRSRPIRAVALVGAIGVLASTILPWVSLLGASPDAFDVPLSFLWDPLSTDFPVDLGAAIAALGGLAFVLSFVPRTTALRRLCGVLVVGMAIAFAVSVARELGGDAPDVAAPGGFVALGGGLLLLFGR